MVRTFMGSFRAACPMFITHESGLKMLELFAGENGLCYKGGFVIGMGAMLNGQPLNKLLNGKKAEKGFKLFLENIANQQNSPPELYHEAQLKMPGSNLLAYGNDHEPPNRQRTKGKGNGGSSKKSL